MSDAASRGSGIGNKDQMKYLRSCFEQENKRWAQILGSPQKLEEHLSKRLDSDKIIFSAASESFPHGCIAECADGATRSACNSFIRASAISKRPSRRSASISR